MTRVFRKGIAGAGRSAEHQAGHAQRDGDSANDDRCLPPARGCVPLRPRGVPLGHVFREAGDVRAVFGLHRFHAFLQDGELPGEFVVVRRFAHVSKIGVASGPVNAAPLAIAAAFLLAFPATGLAQAGPDGGAADAEPGLRATLGDCPADLLRRAWTEMLPLEAEAVEREVLALCTERSEAIVRFLDAQARLDGSLAVMRAPVPSTAAAATSAPADDRVELLRAEIASLRGRIARLEGEPERPETEAALADLRDELATAEADLARVEAAGATVADGPAAVLPSGASGTEPSLQASAATVSAAIGESDASGEVPFPTLPPTAPLSGTALSGALPEAVPGVPGSEVPLPGSQASGQAASLPPPGTAPLDAPSLPAGPALAGVTQAGAAHAPDCRSEWRVIHAVRGEGGPWRVRLQALREEAVPLPAPPSDDPDAPALPTVFHCAPVLDPPVTLAVGEGLPDGTMLLVVTPEGVRLSGPGSPGADPVLLPFAKSDDGAPGVLDWDVERIGEDGT